ncbi:MAG: hypothetical protein HC890_14420 [Chloroflexaceae bacterium]|nr:hypothetical protein [Chloroflexaceae bacterium]
MEIGVPKEIKDQEFRVGLSPDSVRVLSDRGHAVFVETTAGVGAGFADGDYQSAGAKIVSREPAWSRELVVKVKEPLPPEYDFLQNDQFLFTYLHLAADRPLTERLISAGTRAIAYETVELTDGKIYRCNNKLAFKSGDAIRFHVIPQTDGYAYIMMSRVPAAKSPSSSLPS